MISSCRCGDLLFAHADAREMRDAANGGEIDGHRTLLEGPETSDRGPIHRDFCAGKRRARRSRCRPRFDRLARAVLAAADDESPDRRRGSRRAPCPRKARLIGLDLGTKTIGLALSDVERRLASPLKTLPRTAFQKDADALVAIFREFEIAGVVLGLPLDLEGRDEPARAVDTRLRPQPRDARRICRSPSGTNGSPPRSSRGR